MVHFEVTGDTTAPAPADGIPVDRKTGKVEAPHTIVTLTAEQIEETQALGTFTLTAEQWRNIRQKSPQCPKRFNNVLPVTFNDCLCGIDGEYVIALSRERIAVLHYGDAGVSVESVRYKLFSNGTTSLRMNDRGEFYVDGKLVPFPTLLKAFATPPDAAKGSKDGSGSTNTRWLVVELPVGSKPTDAVFESRLKEIAAAAEHIGLQHNLFPKADTQATRTPKPVDWAEVATLLKATDPATVQHATAQLDEKLTPMRLKELLAALDEVAAAGIPPDQRELLEQHICQELGGPKGGPALVLNRFVDSSDTVGWRYTLGFHFKQWIDRDPDHAIAWLAKNAGRIKDLSFGFLDTSFYPLLKTSPDAAIRLLETVPPSRRLHSLASFELASLSDELEVAWVKVVRNHLPKQDRIEAITWPTMAWSDGDGAPMNMQEVDAYMKRIDATREERKACILCAAFVRAAAGTSRRDDLTNAEWIEAMRAWVTTQAPDLVDRATGEALNGYHFHSFQEAADLALRYHDKSHNDELLIPLLEKRDRYDTPATARKLAEHLTNKTLRKKYLEKFKEIKPPTKHAP